MDELKHHGVKGQKWGVRKERDSNGGRGSVGSKTSTTKRKKTKKKKTNTKSAVAVGLGLAGTALAVIGRAALIDIAFNDGNGVRDVGRRVVGGFCKLRGDTNIHWE